MPPRKNRDKHFPPGTYLGFGTCLVSTWVLPAWLIEGSVPVKAKVLGTMKPFMHFDSPVSISKYAVLETLETKIFIL